MSALNDPLCEGEGGSVSPPLSYSSSPVKSESAASKSSCEWSDLIEQDEKELQVGGCRSCRFIVYHDDTKPVLLLIGSEEHIPTAH